MLIYILFQFAKLFLPTERLLKGGKYIPVDWGQNPSLRHTKASPEGEAAEKSHGK